MLISDLVKGNTHCLIILDHIYIFYKKRLNLMINVDTGEVFKVEFKSIASGSNIVEDDLYLAHESVFTDNGIDTHDDN